ncbi:Uncharacterized protein APZ42_027703 [Daphnia magna]|uniref:Uncharacterized protein n=1 Tax=Daphnia magna TaxID=35525 RepID=A0A164R7D1_9CRUS|nr:Uncharacterized protein APZ42_027703 [Daphnia magna]
MPFKMITIANSPSGTERIGKKRVQNLWPRLSKPPVLSSLMSSFPLCWRCSMS